MLSNFNQELIRLLQQDALQSKQSLAAKLNSSPSTVRRRIKALLESGELKIVGVVNPGGVGYPITAVLCLKIPPRSLGTAMATITSWPEVTWASSTDGRYNIVCICRFVSTEQMSDLTNNHLPLLKGIDDSEISICLKILRGKYTQV